MDDKIWKELKTVSPINPPTTEALLAEAERLLKKYGCPVSAQVAIATGLIIELVERERLELLAQL